MSPVLYASLRVLIVDDFNNFRMTLNKIIYELGFKNVDSAAKGEEAYALCEKEHYDIVLCDYNLGYGKNGQQLLEDLRLNQLLRPEDIFILLSAETSRNVVMSAYDCEPDAYLTKPITTKVIEQRIKRLLAKRNEMVDVYSSLDRGDKQEAILSLQKKMHNNSRYSMDCQKILAELYFEENELDQAETVYRNVLEIRALDWAQVGLARVKITKGDTEKAIQWLNEIIESNPSCMKAYDALSLALKKQENMDGLQKNLEKAVEISPMSIGRQVSLAETALENGDAEIAANAYQKVIKFGVNSSHNTTANQLAYTKAVARFYDNDPVKAGAMSKTVMKLLNAIEEKETITDEIKLKSQLLGSQIWALSGHKDKSKEIMDYVSERLSGDESITIDVEIEIVNSLIANNHHNEAQNKVQDMIQRYQNDEAALEKMDALCSEPVSAKGKKMLARANKLGIQSYKSQNFEDAIEYFSTVERRYPRYIGVKLNLAQSILGKLRRDGLSDDEVNRCTSLFSIVERYVKSNSDQYKRYQQLQEMLTTLCSEK
jgi:DNA-binding NarL/FixJ family response regulator